VPLFYYLAFPEAYYSGIEIFPLSAWVFSGAMMFLLIGSVQGVASGFALGVADALWHDIAHSNWRLILGAGSGLALSTLLILLSLWGVANPKVGAGVFIPMYILYGLAFGAAAAIVIPRLGATAPLSRQLKRAAVATLVTGLITVPHVFLVYPNIVSETLPHRLSFAAVFPLTMAVLFARRTKRVADHQSLPTGDRRLPKTVGSKGQLSDQSSSIGSS
jgi:Na+(H+)/acetate symporter ActP